MGSRRSGGIAVTGAGARRNFTRRGELEEIDGLPFSATILLGSGGTRGGCSTHGYIPGSSQLRAHPLQHPLPNRDLPKLSGKAKGQFLRSLAKTEIGYCNHLPSSVAPRDPQSTIPGLEDLAERFHAVSCGHRSAAVKRELKFGLKT